MSEGIAKVVRDIKTRRVLDPAVSAVNDDRKLVSDLREVHDNLIMLVTEFVCPVIDSTPMYEQIVNGPQVNLYDDFNLMPVWENALIGYENKWGNVYVIQCYVIDKENDNWTKKEWDDSYDPPYEWETPNPVDWEAVRYRFVAVLWSGGRSKGQHVNTVGPIYRWDAAVYEDGQIGDLRWTALYDFDGPDAESIHQNAMLIWLQTYTLAGCSNVEIVTPLRKKPERKRLERLGVNPQTIVIKKTGKAYRHTATDTSDMIGGVPQSFVRGHYARYGPEYDRGLLFGKYAGKFWVPAFARGDSGREIDYTVEAG